MWMTDHNAKECASCKSKKLLHSDEGEHDFVVLGADYIAIIEVKNSKENVSGSSSSAKEQLAILVNLIEGVSKKFIQLRHSNERMADEAAASKLERTVISASSSNQKPIIEKQRLNRIAPKSKISPIVESKVNQSDTFHRETSNSHENDEKTAACQKAVEYQATAKTDLSATKSFKIVRCVAFPGIENPSTLDLSIIESEANIITASDLDCFSTWWDQNIEL